MKISSRLLVALLVPSIIPALQAAPARKPAAKKATSKPSSAPKSTPISNTDPQRFFKVKEWKGSFTTGAKSSGEKKEQYSTTTWSSAITVQARFKLKPHLDNRNVDPLSWRGKGEAHIVVSGKRKTQSKDEVVIDTYLGDYIDTFNVEISNIDVAKGTYQMSVIRDLWQQQPHKGKAIEHTEVRITRDGTYTRTEVAPGHSWADDGGAGFGRESPLPKQGVVINGSMVSKNNDFLSQDGSRWPTTWTIEPGGPDINEPLKAIAGGPYETERGRSVNLDGWQSTGKIRSYKWKFEPVEPNSTIPFNAGAGKEGRRVSTVFLAPVKVTLTVSDGTREDSDAVVVKISAREYKTPFVHREEEKLHPKSIPPRMIKGHDLRYAGGENVCALDDYNDKDSIHILHPAATADNSWENRGYVLKQVEDPGGPFDDVWYLSSYSLQVERQSLINKYIVPKGPPPVRTAKRFYDANKELGNDVDGYLAAVRKHEMMHTERMQQALPANDPGPKIEAWAGKDKDALKKQVDDAILASEKAIDAASADPLPTFWNGKIAFPDDATDKYITMDMQI